VLAASFFRANLIAQMGGALYVHDVELPSARATSGAAITAGGVGWHSREQLTSLVRDADDQPFMLQPFDAAVEHFASRRVVPFDEFDDMVDAERFRAFSMKNAANEAIIERAHALLRASVNRPEVGGFGPGLQDFIRQIRADEARLGFTPSSRFYLETVFRTATATSYAAGRMRSQLSPNVKASTGFWEYRTAGDGPQDPHPATDLHPASPGGGRVRNPHWELDGKQWSMDDPAAREFYPPNGFNCRCVMVAIDAEDVDEARLQRPVGAELRDRAIMRGFRAPPTDAIAQEAATAAPVATVAPAVDSATAMVRQRRDAAEALELSLGSIGPAGPRAIARGTPAQARAGREARQVYHDHLGAAGMVLRGEDVDAMNPRKVDGGALPLMTLPAKKLGRGTLAMHGWNGRVYVRKDVADRARRASAWVARNPDRPLREAPADIRGDGVHGVQVLMHEEVHGHGHLKPDGYRGPGKYLEEATTEEAAREMTRRFMGVTPAEVNDDPELRSVLGPPIVTGRGIEVPPEQRDRAGRQSYNRFRQALYRATRAAAAESGTELDDDELQAMVADLSVRFRSDEASPESLGLGEYRTGARYVTAFTRLAGWNRKAAKAFRDTFNRNSRGWL